nr:lysylphosphatidylglycerol synthase transmembrane domain-containing protein [Arthrospiribacter ruber]
MAIAIWIFWFLYKDISFRSLQNALRETSLFWMLASVIISLLGFYLRAWRWKILIIASEKSELKTSVTFAGLMIGYLANLLVPRAGEVVRCGAVSKMNDNQVGTLVGTVVVERTIDLLFMLLTVFLGFLLEREMFLSLISDLVSTESLLNKLLGMLPVVIGGGLITVIFLYLLFQKYRESNLIKKVRHFIRDLVSGIFSLRKVENQWGFWGSSVAIWVIYYITMIFVAWAIPSTASLSLGAILMVMVMGSIGMLAPVQGGIGTFHALVAFILMAYGLSNEEGKIFAVIIHSVQVLTVVVLGMACLGYFFKITSDKTSKSL